MPPATRPRRQPTDNWSQVQLFVASAEQATYEILRPIVLFGQLPADRARETGVPERTLRRKAARFDVAGMRSLFDLDPSPVVDKRRLPPEVRRAISSSSRPSTRCSVCARSRRSAKSASTVR